MTNESYFIGKLSPTLIFCVQVVPEAVHPGAGQPGLRSVSSLGQLPPLRTQPDGSLRPKAA